MRYAITRPLVGVALWALGLPFTLPAQAQTAVPADPAKPEIEPKRNNAAKLAGLVGFVNTACPELAADTARFKVAVERLGLDPAELEQGDLHLRALAYLESYRKDVPANCARALETFGPESRIVPGLVTRR
ncbi:hypothetical protein [Methylobacterium sp. A54F]